MTVESLEGMRVAITGRLASMSRAGAIEWIQARGGQYAPGVNRQTSMLIVGQEDWPLQQNGKLTLSLQKAQRLQQRGHAIAILAEADWIARFNLNSHGDGVHRLYTLAQLIELLKVPKQRARAWLRAGLIQPVQETYGIFYFDFRQVVGAKTLCELADAGVSIDSIRRSLEQLRVWLADADQPLNQLAWLEKNGQLLVRMEEGLVEPSGQLCFDFGDDPSLDEESEGPRPTLTGEFASSPKAATTCRSAASWFELGCEHEHEGFLAEAAHAYRQALLQSERNADACFNLANVLYALGKKAEACERYRQALEVDPSHCDAWNNLGIALEDLAEHDDAVDAYRQAIALGHLDAHYALAKLLDGLNRHVDAVEHWRACARHDPHSVQGKYARTRLG